MSIGTAPITAEQLLAMPENGVERDLIRGELRERPMTKRNRFHTRTVSRITFLLETWLDSQPARSGEIHSGEVGTILRRDPDTVVGIDVAYFSHEVMARQTDQTTIVEGSPSLAVEVLSPSDKLEEIRDKVVEYLNAGVEMVWIVDPYFQTVQVHRRGIAPITYNRDHRLGGDEVFPGLDIAVIDIFIRHSDQSP